MVIGELTDFWKIKRQATTSFNYRIYRTFRDASLIAIFETCSKFFLNVIE